MAESADGSGGGGALRGVFEEAMPESADGSGGGGALVNRAKSCYCCGCRYNHVHSFYASMCRTCGDFNFVKRLQVGSVLFVCLS
jgi:hypothetical protein